MRLLEEAGVRPSARMGQSFLVDGGCLRRLAAAVAAGPGRPAAVIEIGSGPGNLTEALLDEGLAVVAVERDRRLAAACARRLGGRAGFRQLVADILHPPFAPLADGARLAVAGNIPYSITGEVLRIVTDELPRAARATFVVQEEVAGRLLAAPGSRAYGALTVLMRARWEIARGIAIPAASFHPRPAVDSRQVLLARRAAGPVPDGRWPLFRRVVREAFNYRRKTLSNALARVAGALGEPAAGDAALLRAAGIDPGLRPERLSVDDFARLVEEIAKTMDGGRSPPQRRRRR